MCVSTSPHAKAAGSSKLDVNLKRSLAETNSAVRHIRIDCPRNSGLPITCKMTGIETINHKPVPVRGKLAVLGIATSTHTYAYRLVYAPSKGA